MGKSQVARRWGIRFDSKTRIPSGNYSYFLFAPWVMSGALPSCIYGIVAYRTRREARDMARTLRKKYYYLRPHHVWNFRAVPLSIKVEAMDEDPGTGA